MMVAVNSNALCTVSANKAGAAGWRESFNAAFRAGGVMGFSLCGVSLIVLYVLCLIYKGALTKTAQLVTKIYLNVLLDTA